MDRNNVPLNAFNCTSFYSFTKAGVSLYCKSMCWLLKAALVVGDSLLH